MSASTTEVVAASTHAFDASTRRVYDSGGVLALDASNTPEKPEAMLHNSQTIGIVELGSSISGAVDARPSTIFPAATPKTRRTAAIHFTTLCLTLFLAGWNDGTTGPLLPRIKEVYHVGFTLVSLLFIFGCLGCVIGAVANVYLTNRYGFGTVMVVGAVAQVIGYTVNAPAPPFPVLVMGYTLNGFGVALEDAGANAYVASLKDNASVKMGILHAIYGVGAFAAPLVATQFADMSRWSFHYIVSIAIAVANLVALIAVFRFKKQDDCLAEIGQPPLQAATSNDKKNTYKQIFRLKAVHLLGVFVLTYVGVEVTMGGWIVTYARDVRGGGFSSGYISSGFFGGLALGRVALLWLNHLVGEKHVVFIYIILAIALELIVWLVPSLVGGAVAVSFVGVVLGPIYPIVMNHSARVLPPRLLSGSIGWIAGFGQAGSAFLPFLTGALASSKGIPSLQPLLVAMMGFMLILWMLVRGSPRRDN